MPSGSRSGRVLPWSLISLAGPRQPHHLIEEISSSPFSVTSVNMRVGLAEIVFLVSARSPQKHHDGHPPFIVGRLRLDPLRHSPGRDPV